MITKTRQSSLRGLRTFCFAARHLSFRTAAENLNVTASAVSHQIKNLEDELNTPLFIRTSRTLDLTAAGEKLYAEIDPLIDQLDKVMSRFKAPTNKRTLRISVQPFFASEMFVPRLEEFTSQHPNVEIFVDTSDESAETHPATMDASIRLFRRVPDNLSANPLLSLKLIPACSPDFLKRFANPDDRLKNPFPVILHSSRPTAWQHWQDATGIKLKEPSGTVIVDSMIAVARAAERGVGAALVPLPLSENWFKHGALVPLFDETTTMDDSFYFVTQKSGTASCDVKALRKWTVDTFAMQA